MMTRNDAVAMQLFCVMMTFSDALPVLSTKNDGHCHHSRMGVFPDYYLKIIGWPARLAHAWQIALHFGVKGRLRETAMYQGNSSLLANHSYSLSVSGLKNPKCYHFWLTFCC